MDGVVLDSEPLHEVARQIMFRELEITPDSSFPDPVGKSASGYWRIVTRQCGIEADPFALEERQFCLVADQIEKDHVQPSDGLRDVFAWAKEHGVKTALASSSARILVDRALSLLGIRECFDYVVTGDEVKTKKPAPDIYLKVLELSGIPAKDARAVEDTGVGIAAAQAAGIYCCGYVNITSGEQDISAADRIIRNLRECVG